MTNRTRAVARSLANAWGPVLLGLVFVALLVRRDAVRDSLSLPDFVVFAVLGLAIATALRWPVASLAIVAAVLLLQLTSWLQPPTAPTWPEYVAAPLVAALIALRPTGALRLVTLPLGAAYAVLAAINVGWVRSQNDFGWTTWFGDVGFGAHPLRTSLIMLALAGFGIYTISWALGISFSTAYASRLLRQAQSQLERTDLSLRLSLDRARISREVHDALAHSLAVIVSQADGALAQHENRPETAGPSFQNISDVGRAALIDVRRLIETIQDEDSLLPRPTSRDIEALIERMRAAGMHVELIVSGKAAEAAASTELAIFRIVQESMTNALKHSGRRARASVVLEWGAQQLHIRIESQGDEPQFEPKHHSSLGVGVEGMKERARLAGGRLTAVSDGSFFVVDAQLPILHDPVVAALPASERPVIR